MVKPGAALGGWRQVIMVHVGCQRQVIATDILERMPLRVRVSFRVNLLRKARCHAMLEALGNRRVNVVLYDMAPNLSGQMAISQPVGMCLV